MKRFGFLKFLGVGAAAAVITPVLPAPAATVVQTPMTKIVMPNLEKIAQEITTMEPVPYGSGGAINARMFFASQSKVLERVYHKALDA